MGAPAIGPALADNGLPALARAAGEEFRPVTAADVHAARREVMLAVDRVNTTLGPGAFGDGWRRRLLLEQVREELSAERPKLTLLNTAYDRLTDGTPGL